MIRRATARERLLEIHKTVAAVTEGFAALERAIGGATLPIQRAWSQMYRGLEAACIRERGKLPGSHRTARLRKKRRKAIEAILEGPC